jgi:hypothetical protein
MGIINFFTWFFKPSTNRDQTYIVDDSGEKFSLLDYINDLENRIEKLESENIETTNILYEIMNTLDKFDDSEYDLHNFKLGE